MQEISRTDWFFERVQAMEPTLFRTAYALLQNTADGEDAVQSALTRAYACFGSLRVTERFAPWLLRILKNECYTLLRRRKFWAPLDAEKESADEMHPPDPDFSAAFGKLPQSQRLLLTLYYYEGYTTGEIAAVLAIPSGTVKSRLARARKALGALLADKEIVQ